MRYWHFFRRRLGFPTDLELQRKEKDSYLRKVKVLFDKAASPSSGSAWKLLDLAYTEGDSEQKAKRIWKSYAREDAAINEFLAAADPSGEKHAKLLDRLLKLVLKEKSVSQTWTGIKALLDVSYVERQRSDAKAPMRSVGIPAEIIEKFLPAPFTFEVGPDGELLREYSVFGNKRKTIAKKGADMARILERWNDLVSVITADMTSPDATTRLCAIISFLMLQTGIRPGFGGTSRLKENGKVIKDENGKPTYIKTFGATGLRLEHLEFIRDDFAKLEFPGKAGTVNVTYLTNTDLIKALRTQVDALQNKEGSDLIFVTSDGKRVSNGTVNRYLKSILGPSVSATDFRKLRATDVFYRDLRDRKEELVEDLKAFKDDAVEAVTAKVVEVITSYLEESVDKAADAISHKDHKVTIESYITPRVVLMFLTDGGIDRALPEIIGSGRDLKVSFDPVVFFEKVTGMHLDRRASTRLASVLFSYGEPFTATPPDRLIEALEEELL